MFRDYRVTVDYRLLRGRTSGMGGGMTYTTWYHLMYWYDMIWYDMIPDNVIWCQWIICCTIWCSLVFIYLLVFDIHIDYLTWPYYHLINEYRLKKCTADFVTGSWSISQSFVNGLLMLSGWSIFFATLTSYCPIIIRNSYLLHI